MDDKMLLVSALILGLVKEGLPVRVAFDAVLGEGAYEKLAGEVWGLLVAQPPLVIK
jgi:hypothetical protein